MRIKTSILEAQPFLRGMTGRQLDLLADNSMLAEFNAGDTILNHGDAANRFYLILEGQVELQTPGWEGESVRVQTIGPGDVLGWSWLFPPYYWHLDARAVTPIKSLFFYGTRLRELCDENHDLGYELMRRVSEIIIKRLQAACRELEEQKRLTADAAGRN